MRTVLLALLAAAVSFIADLGIAAVASRVTHVPRDFPPFTFLPILSGAAGGALLGALAYSMLRMTVAQPERMFFFIAISFLALSFGLPLRLSYTHSLRFAGVTPAAQMALVLMHAVVAAVSVVTLTWPPGRLR